MRAGWIDLPGPPRIYGNPSFSPSVLPCIGFPSLGLGLLNRRQQEMQQSHPCGQVEQVDQVT